MLTKEYICYSDFECHLELPPKTWELSRVCWPLAAQNTQHPLKKRFLTVSQNQQTQCKTTKGKKPNSTPQNAKSKCRNTRNKFKGDFVPPQSNATTFQT